MQYIFKQCPHQNAKKNHQRYFRKGMAHPYGLGDKVTHNWKPYGRNCPPHSEGQELFQVEKMSQKWSSTIAE